MAIVVLVSVNGGLGLMVSVRLRTAIGYPLNAASFRALNPEMKHSLHAEVVHL